MCVCMQKVAQLWFLSKITMVTMYTSSPDLMVFCCYSYDVVFTAGADTILSKFKDFNARVVFSAEGFCWPDSSLAVSALE